jgi:HK97 family phage prohead protease/HK97 family phage major capsid protein
MKKDKVLYLTQQFTKDMPLPTSSETIDSINIEGYANTTTVDRVGDVIPMTAWVKALDNYLKNPIILAYHEDCEPIGRMVDHRVDEKGLWVKARISAAAEDVFNLIKDGVLTAFSVGFIVKDAVYDAVTDLFIIKELELLEISVVAVPCNQDSTFSLSKSFDDEKDYNEFKSQFAEKKVETKELTPPAPAAENIKKEWNMDPKELEQLLATAATNAAVAVIKAQADAAIKAAEEKSVKDAEDAIINAKVAAAIQTGQSGAEKLFADIEKRFADQSDASAKTLAGLEATIKEKAAELEAIQKSKMSFGDKSAPEAITYQEKETAVLAAKAMGVAFGDTKIGRALIEKAGPHVASATWELEVSLNMENEVRRRLVVAPLIKHVQMKTNVMTIPVNPESSNDANWMASSGTAFGTTESAGTPRTHLLKEVTLNAYKVATREYLAYEEEEDSLIVLLPVIRDAMIRRIARGVDKAYLIGAGTGTDPVKGLAKYDATSVVQPTNTGAASIANLRSLRKDLGYWGLNPSEIVYVVSTDVYYDLLDDTLFQTMDKVGTSATLLTGQIGMIGNTPVLVSDAFPAKAGGTSVGITTNVGAICVAAANFMGGTQRGLRLDTQDLVETQRKVMVASLRTGFTQFSTANGDGVSVLRWL